MTGRLEKYVTRVPRLPRPVIMLWEGRVMAKLVSLYENLK